jgi:uncharacterized protein (TIGR00255 family)
MESMTGYAFVEKSARLFSYSVELKSLNSRYLEISVNLPKVLKNEENEMHNFLKNRFSRGKLELTIDMYDWTAGKPLTVNEEMIKMYYRRLDLLRKELAVCEPLRFESVLSLDGVSRRERTVMSRGSIKDIYGTVAVAAAKAVQMRKKEGTAIKRDLGAIAKNISGRITRIKMLAKNAPREKYKLMKKRTEALLGSSVDKARLYAEFAILADKLDINEEIVRFMDHLEKFNALMRISGQIGKKLDFMAQEMFREINTIGSKSGSSEIAYEVVEVKNHIEKIREHCRNIV